jgi:predicted ArsR family transcriptional regulator
MSLRERIETWLSAGNCGTSSQIAHATGGAVRLTRQALARLHAAGVVEAVQELNHGPVADGGRPCKVWVIAETRPAPRHGVKASPAQAVELGRRLSGATAGERILAWLGQGNTGTVPEICATVDASHSAVARAIRELCVLDLAEVVGFKKKQGMGRPLQVYAWTGAMPPLPAEDEDDDDRRPLNNTPAEVLVRSAISSQPALATIWGAASFTTQGTTA